MPLVELDDELASTVVLMLEQRARDFRVHASGHGFAARLAREAGDVAQAEQLEQAERLAAASAERLERGAATVLESLAGRR